MITFPTDMPLTTDFTSVNTQGFININGPPSSGIPATANTFYVNGCPTYSSLTAAQLTISIYNMRNKGYVADTATFSIYVYAT